MSDFPKFVEFHEEGPREGFQIECQTYPVAQRARLIEALASRIVVDALDGRG